jgi:hypothetical protein
MAIDLQAEAKAKLRTTVMFYGVMALAAIAMGIAIYWSS